MFTRVIIQQIANGKDSQFCEFFRTLRTDSRQISHGLFQIRNLAGRRFSDRPSDRTYRRTRNRIYNGFDASINVRSSTRLTCNIRQICSRTANRSINRFSRLNRLLQLIYGPTSFGHQVLPLRKFHPLIIAVLRSKDLELLPIAAVHSIRRLPKRNLQELAEPIMIPLQIIEACFRFAGQRFLEPSKIHHMPPYASQAKRTN